MTGLVMLGAFIALQVTLWSLRAVFGAVTSPSERSTAKYPGASDPVVAENVSKCLAADLDERPRKENGHYARKLVAEHRQAIASAPRSASEQQISRGGGMKIRCQSCGNTEQTSVGLIVKLVGGAMPVGGFWAWVTFLFAGTGFALPICIAIVIGGTAMLVFKKEITEWIIRRGYACAKCGGKSWEPHGQ